MRILFISGSIGLGHVTRDLAIARAFRALAPEAQIFWLAGEPAKSVIRQAGERLHAEADRYQGDSEIADCTATVGGMNVFRYLMNARRQWTRNARFVAELIRRESFDAIVGDETYEVGLAMREKKLVSPAPFVMIYDFLGLDATTTSLAERFGVYYWNRVWSKDGEIFASGRNRALFIGEPEDIPDRTMGFGLPNRRAHARRYYRFIGYVLPFEAAEVADRQAIRAELGYSDAPLVVVSVGGTATGRDLLEACGQAFTLASASIPGMQMTLVCGPRIAPQTMSAPQGVRVEGFVERLYRHFAACDLAIVQAGGTTTLELTALRRPFVYVPLEGQCEQEVVVAGRLARHHAGIGLTRHDMTAERLAELIVGNIGKEPDWPRIPVQGAAVAARQVLDAVQSVLG
jgi:UDP-N-acetylglucosamine:LPS N-acetylglucosamine transferase